MYDSAITERDDMLAEPLTVQEMLHEASNHSEKQILIVDDELFNLQAMMVVLKVSAQQLGYPPSLIERIVDQELTGQGAVHQVIGNKKQYKLIITDLSMPVMDGYQATKKIRQYMADNLLHQPVIIACTGHTE